MALARRQRSPLVLQLLLAAPACADPPPPAAPAPVDAKADAPPPQAFGARCGPDLPCAPGLACQDSEFAPFPWCARPCPVDRVKDHCDAVPGEPQGFCVQMPTGWRGPTAPFCVPECANLAECQGHAPGWEACTKPKYKNTNLYPALPTRVCQAPSAHGQIHVDPTTCDWEAQVTDPMLQAAKGLCKAFCQFKKDCQLRKPAETAACCGWTCFQWLTPGGAVDAPREAALKCHIKSYSANTGTPLVCTAWKDDCKGLQSVPM